MTTDSTTCPECSSAYAYRDGPLWVCPECAHEWSAEAPTPAPAADDAVRDANGTILVTGDSVTLIKELKVKGATSSIKTGTKVKNIRIIEPENGHNIACKIDGFGAMYLKSEFVKKA